MSLDSPISYAEWYWKHSVDAQKAFDAELEKAMLPMFQDAVANIPEFETLTPITQNLIRSFSGSPAVGLGAGLVSAAGEFTAEILRDVCAPGIKILNRVINRGARETWLTAQQASLLSSHNQITDEYFRLLTASEGYEDIAADSLYTSMLPYPSIPEVMSYSRYHDNPDAPWSEFQKWWSISPREFPLWNWLGKQKLTTLQAQTLFKRGYMSQGALFDVLAQIGWQEFDRDPIRDLSYTLPNSMLLVQGGLIEGLSPDTLLRNISKGDIHPDYAQTYLDAVLTKPASQDLIAYQLRKDPDLSNLDEELQKIGIHPNYLDVYKTLAYQIPPVADIITMSVREAFTPSIAAKFGQYEDFPEDLEKYAGMKGLSPDWAKRYWAAHWALPSAQQGFEMLHRGVINDGELNMLLRAQDVMPFWRDKLVQIAYRRLTRVDVRRMYREGVLDEGEVYEAYLEHGYNPENARRMSEFTIKQTLSSLSKFTSADITKAYAAGMIDAGQARSLLESIGISSKDAFYIVGTAEYKRQWAFTDDQIAGIRNLYKKRVYNENQARDKLAGLNLASGQINVLMEQWFYEKVEELDATWTTAQTIKFLKRKLITPERAKRELYLNGYDEEHADMYIRDAKWKPPKE